MAAGESDLSSETRVSLKAAGDELSTCLMANVGAECASIVGYCSGLKLPSAIPAIALIPGVLFE